MHSMTLLKERVYDELNRIAENGITNGNLDATYKLVDIYKDITEIEGPNTATDGSDLLTREYDRYLNNKASYRSTGGSDCKRRMMETLEEYMDSFAEKMESMLHDTDCQEERDTINRYLSRLKSLR